MNRNRQIETLLDELRLLTVAVDALVEHEVRRALESVQRARAIAEVFVQRMQDAYERDSGRPGSP